MNKPMTVDEIHGYVTHYNAFKSLPDEIMENLFASALTVAILCDRKNAEREAKTDGVELESAKVSIDTDKQEPVKAKVAKRLKS